MGDFLCLEKRGWLFRELLIMSFKEAIGAGDWEIRKASPETGPSQVLARVAASRSG